MSKSALILSSAKRAKELAEEKFKARDIKAAIKYATMARQLNPIMDGIDAYLFAYNIHMVASTKLNNGVTDWYKVLNVADVFADSETIEKRYTKMVYMLQPIIKNGSAEAEGALELVNRAWKVLSNPKNRRVFDNGSAHCSSLDHTRHASSHARVHPKHAPHTSSSGGAQLQAKWGDGHGGFSHGKASRPTRMASKKSAAVGATTPHHPGSGATTKFERKTCPRCCRWCKYEKGKSSIITCPSCKKNFDVISSSSVAAASEVSRHSSSRIKLNERFPILSS